MPLARLSPASLIIAALILAGMTQAPAQAQIPPQAQVPLQRRPRRADVTAQLRWVQFSLVAGRIEASSQHFGRSMNSQSSRQGRQETLSISVADGVPVVRYELATDSEFTTIHVANHNEVEIHREPRGDSTVPPLDFAQMPRRQSTLTIGADGDRRVFQGQTLWHVLLADPVAGGEQLAPLLELLNPEWKLADRVAALEARLLDPATPPRVANVALWSELIAQLGSDRYSARRSADHKLRAAGPGLLAHLQLLDRSTLDAEQRLRVQRIAAAATGNLADDSPHDLADWLAWDPRVWLTLMERDELSVRSAAATRLSHLLGRPIPFNPTADAVTRQGQLQSLRDEIIPAGA